MSCSADFTQHQFHDRRYERLMLDCARPCQNKQDRSTVSVDCVQLNKWGNIGNKIGGYQIYDFDHRFDMNYMSYRQFQMSILISDIQALCQRLCVWAKTWTTAKKLDSLIQISSRISKVLQSEHHRDSFRNKK